MTDPVLAIALSDVHLQIRPPVARSKEPSWWEAMARPWRQVKELQRRHQCAVLCAGDLFDRWNPPPELINWALVNLPEMIAIPGNHDLPSHNPTLVYRSAFDTLVRANLIRVADEKPQLANAPKSTGFGKTTKHRLPLFVYGRPFNGKAPVPKEAKGLHVLLTHEYLWVTGAGFHGAPEEKRLGKRAKRFAPFDVVVVGDNHIPFRRKLKGGTRVVNCGGLMRRRSDEKDHKPRVVLIHESGRTSSHQLDISGEKFSKSKKKEPRNDPSIAEFVDELLTLEHTGLDFEEAIMEALARLKAARRIKKLMLEALARD